MNKFLRLGAFSTARGCVQRPHMPVVEAHCLGYSSFVCLYGPRCAMTSVLFTGGDEDRAMGTIIEVVGYDYQVFLSALAHGGLDPAE